jgi:hypothetical protein
VPPSTPPGTGSVRTGTGLTVLIRAVHKRSKGRYHHVPPYGSKPEGLPDGVFGRAPVSEGRPHRVRTCLPGGSSNDAGGVPVQAAACRQWRSRVLELSEYPARIVAGAMDQDLDMDAVS